MALCLVKEKTINNNNLLVGCLQLASLWLIEDIWKVVVLKAFLVIEHICLLEQCGKDI